MSAPSSLRILHVSSPLSWRGGEQQVHYLYTNLMKMGCIQRVFCPVGSELSKRVAADDVIPYKKRSGFDVWAARKLTGSIKHYQPDVIHAHDAHAHTTAVLAATLFGMSTPVILSRRVDFHVGRSWFSRFKYTHQSIRAIVCVSQAIEEMVRTDLDSPSHPFITTVHSGVDLGRFDHINKGKLRSELGIDDDVFLVGNVAALADHKDYPTFLRTAQQLQDERDIRFVIIGTGPMEEEIKQMAVELNVTDRVTFLGFRTDLQALFADLDVFLFPSKTEGLGTSVLDALGYGVPVVATRAGGIPEIIDHDVNGLLADVGDHEQLAHFIQQLKADAAKRTDLIRAGREKLKQFSHEQTAQNTFGIYQKILV
ncbi:MAG: glycosyltransferase family 4 protein [Flavobacteriales bacterium]|nr:glycosyltransferase family 4 protein [Flavobacteriales bacterium]